MRILAVAIAISAGIIFSAGEARSDMSVSKYQKNISSSEKRGMTEFYLEAVGTGITWTHSAFSANINYSLYCPPRGFTLTGDLARRLLNDFLRKNLGSQVTEKDSVSFALLKSLVFSYPC
jgi:hypothetical protein